MYEVTELPTNALTSSAIILPRSTPCPPFVFAEGVRCNYQTSLVPASVSQSAVSPTPDASLGSAVISVAVKPQRLLSGERQPHSSVRTSKNLRDCWRSQSLQKAEKRHADEVKELSELIFFLCIFPNLFVCRCPRRAPSAFSAGRRNQKPHAGRAVSQGGREAEQIQSDVAYGNVPRERSFWSSRKRTAGESLGNPKPFKTQAQIDEQSCLKGARPAKHRSTSRSPHYQHFILM